MQTWDSNSLSRFAAKFRFISSIVSPWGGPEGTNTQAQSEQPQQWLCSTHTIARAMPDYSVLVVTEVKVRRCPVSNIEQTSKTPWLYKRDETNGHIFPTSGPDKYPHSAPSTSIGPSTQVCYASHRSGNDLLQRPQCVERRSQEARTATIRATATLWDHVVMSCAIPGQLK
jgi:hypothetical protein